MAPRRRLAALAAALAGPGPAPAPSPSAAAAADDDIVITAACRTPIGRAGRGAFAETPPDRLLSTVLKGTIERAGIEPGAVGDICVGNVLQPGAGAMGARMAALVSGLPVETAISTVNRQCSSGLQALANIAGALATGSIDVGIAAGVESMSLNDMLDALPTEMSDELWDNEDAVRKPPPRPPARCWPSWGFWTVVRVFWRSARAREVVVWLKSPWCVCTGELPHAHGPDVRECRS